MFTVHTSFQSFDLYEFEEALTPIHPSIRSWGTKHELAAKPLIIPECGFYVTH